MKKIGAFEVQQIEEHPTTANLDECALYAEVDVHKKTTLQNRDENVQIIDNVHKHRDEVEQLNTKILKRKIENVELREELKKCEERNLQLKKKLIEHGVQNDRLKENISERDTKVNLLTNKIFEMEKRLLNINYRFSMKSIEHCDQTVYHHTGLPSKEIFNVVFETITKVKFSYCHGWVPEIIPKRDQFLLTLMKLKMNLKHFDLSQRFQCSEATVSNIFRTFVLVMYEILFKKLMRKIPSREKNRKCLPNAFLSCSSCRIVLDATEVMSDKPIQMLFQRETFSAYKHYNTWKALIGVAPNGIVTYVSDLYPGSTSDKKIVEHCGVIEQLVPGDLVIADKGFVIKDCLPYGVDLNLPPFLTTPQFTESQVSETKRIASARVHVERAINKIKNFRILTHISSENYSLMNEIFQVKKVLSLVW